jgi:hypothetical protein
MSLQNASLQNANSSQVCPITLNSQAEIKARDGIVYKVQLGNSTKIFDAEALMKCMKPDGSLRNPLTNLPFDDEEKERLRKLMKVQTVQYGEEFYQPIGDLPDNLYWNMTIDVPLKKVLQQALEVIINQIATASMYNMQTRTLEPNRTEQRYFATSDGSTSSATVESFNNQIDSLLGYYFYYPRQPVATNTGRSHFTLITSMKMKDSKAPSGHLVVPFSVIKKDDGLVKVTPKSFSFVLNGTVKINAIKQENYLLGFNPVQPLYPKGFLGGKATKVYKGRKYIVRTGSKGGKYILVKGEKKYV